MTSTIEIQHSQHSKHDDYISLARYAFAERRYERGSHYLWQATAAALGNLAGQRGCAVDTADERLEFAKLLDSENGNSRYYVRRLMLGEYYLDNAERGVMPGDDPSKYYQLAVDFVGHLREMGGLA